MRHGDDPLHEGAPEEDAALDDLSEGVPERVSEAHDDALAPAEAEDASDGLGPRAVAFLGGVVLAVAVLVVLLVRSGGPPPSPEELARRPLNPKPTAPPTGRAAEGRAVYERSCMSCHGREGDGGVGPSLRARRVAEVPDDVILAVVRRGVGSMRPVPMTADEEQLLLAYLRYLQGFPG